MDWDDLEPIDLEPVDPGSDGESRFDLDRPRNRRARSVWIGVVVVGLAAWATIALTNRGTHRQALPPTNTSLPAPAPVPSVVDNRITTLAPRLWAGLRGVGSGRFGVVVDDRLYLLDEASTEAQTTLVPLPEGHVTIDDQNGSSLLASTFEETLVSTAPIETHTLSVRDGAFPAATPPRWWLANGDGTIRSDITGAVLRVPTGLRVVAAIPPGFLALDAKSNWVVWSGSNDDVTPFAASGGQLLATGSRAIALQYHCNATSCPVEILDYAHDHLVTLHLPVVPQFAAFSPDGSRLALVSTAGAVSMWNTATDRQIGATRSLGSATPLPVTWTADGRALLVVQDHQVEIRRATDGGVVNVITHTDGVEQLVALP